MLLNNDWVKEKKKKRSKDTESTIRIIMTFQILRDVAKAVIRGKFISLQTYLKKQEKFQINNLTLHLEELEKEEQKQSEVN